MKIFWENDGEPNAEGQYVATIDMENGSGVQRFIGKTHKDVADSLLQAQASATQKITQLSRDRKVDSLPAKPKLTPRALTADEKKRVAEDITDPDKVESAVSTVVEAHIGAPLPVVRERINELSEDEQAATAAEETKAFLRENPDFFPTPHNNQTLLRFMELNRMDPTRNNFAKAFIDLREANLLTPRPKPSTEPPPQPSPQDGIRPGTRPRGTSSTGLRNGDSGATPAARSNEPAPKYTKIEILSMGDATYKDKFDNEPGFRELVDKLFSKPQASA